MRFLLRPGWLAFVVGVIGFAAACYLLLAPWQFHRNAERSAQNAAIEASYQHPPAPLAQLVAPGAPPAPGVAWREAVVSGSYLPAGEVVVRLRTVEGNPAFEVLTPLRATDGRVVLLDRGYLRPQRANEVPDYPPPPAGQVTVVGRIRPDEVDGAHRAAFVQGGHRQVYVADAGVVGAATGLPVSPGHLQLDAGQPGVLTALPLPQLDSGPFFAYAWQWLIFGAMAVGGLGYFLRLEVLQRRSARAQPAAEAPVPAGTLADRYGRHR